MLIVWKISFFYTFFHCINYNWKLFSNVISCWERKIWIGWTKCEWHEYEINAYIWLEWTVCVIHWWIYNSTLKASCVQIRSSSNNNSNKSHRNEKKFRIIYMFYECQISIANCCLVYRSQSDWDKKTARWIPFKIDFVVYKIISSVHTNTHTHASFDFFWSAICLSWSKSKYRTPAFWMWSMRILSEKNNKKC